MSGIGGVVNAATEVVGALGTAAARCGVSLSCAVIVNANDIITLNPLNQRYIARSSRRIAAPELNAANLNLELRMEKGAKEVGEALCKVGSTEQLKEN